MNARTLFTLAACLATPPSALAQVTAFTDRAAFLNAAGTPTFSEDFESFTADAGFAGTDTVAASGFTLSSTASAGSSRPRVDVAPFQSGGAFGNGTTNVTALTESDRATPVTATLTADLPATAFGADFITFVGTSSNETLFLAALDAAGAELGRVGIPAVSGERFFGFTTDPGVRIASLRLAGTPDGDAGFGRAFSFDNVVGVSVPEPASAALCLAGGLLLLPRRR